MTASMLACFRAALRAGVRARISLVTFGLHATHQETSSQRPMSHLASGGASAPGSACFQSNNFPTCFRAALKAGVRARISLVTFGLHGFHQETSSQRQ